jgi:membrane protease YdiL (CAAX protease family)
MQGIGVLLLNPLFSIPLDELVSIFTGTSQHPNGRMAFLFVQGLGSGLGFLIAAFVIIKWIDKADVGLKQQIKNFRFTGLGLTVLIMVGGILFNALLIDWNANVNFPEILSDLEKILKEKEEQLLVMTKYLTDFENVGEFLMGLLVIGVFAGLGEEFLFRGVLQPKLHLYTGNPHVGIWLTALIFSAIHFQFYGFFPRMLLGAIFGYLYFYSGSLIYPIAAHIMNNAFTVILVYLNKLGKVNFDIEETDQVSISLALLGLLIMILGLKVFKEKNQQHIDNEKLAEGI